MFERYNEPARRSLFFARYEAAILSSLTIETEHLLLGILKDRNPLIAQLVGGHQSADAIRSLTYERAGQPGAPLDNSVEIPFSTDVKRALQYAAEEADRLLHGHIGPEHLLLGVLRLDAGLACDVLRESGLALSAVREALVLHVSASSPPPPEIAAFLFPHHERAERFDGVYVMTALDGPSPGRRATTDDAGVSGGGASIGTIDFRTRADRPPDGRVHSIGPISMSGATLPEFVRVLEGFLGRPIVDDSGLTGRFDIELRGQYDDPETLTAALRDQLGLVLNRALS